MSSGQNFGRSNVKRLIDILKKKCIDRQKRRQEQNSDIKLTKEEFKKLNFKAKDLAECFEFDAMKQNKLSDEFVQTKWGTPVFDYHRRSLAKQNHAEDFSDQRGPVGCHIQEQVLEVSGPDRLRRKVKGYRILGG